VVRPRTGGRRGTAALEFALVAPLFLLIALGGYDLGTAIQTSMRLERAARAGAQYALTQPRDHEGIRAATIAAWPELALSDVPLPTETCLCQATPVSCPAECAETLVWTLSISARREIRPLIIPTLAARSGSAVLRLR
jgi:Flp pilus assembly protein TadG